MREAFSTKQFWNDYWKEEKRTGCEFLFAEIVDRYLDWTQIKNYMEIGGAPGTIMSYMFHTHHLRVNTVDFCDSQILSELLDRNHVEDYHIFSEDFSRFDSGAHRKDNIRGFNWLLYRVMNYDLLKIHNTKTMDLNFLRQAIELDHLFEILYGNYYLSSFLEYSSSNEFFDRHRVSKAVFGALKRICAALRLNNLPNRLFSPYIVFIARRVNG